VPVVICDTSPIRALAHLALLDLLRQLYVQVLVPPAVQHELMNPASGHAIVDISYYPFVQVQAPQDLGRVQALRRLRLDPGESEAVALAFEVPAAILVVDEATARGVVQQLGLALTGTLGVLLEAKAQGLVSQVRPLLDSLQNTLGFFISPKLRADVLRQAGEQP